MHKLMTVEMPDGSKWGVPVEMIARNRAAHYASEFDGDIERSIFEGACHDAESRYLAMLACGAAPQAARAVLPNALKTEVVVTANLREWRHVFRLRLDRAAHPDMRRVMGLVFEKFATEYPVFFEDLCQKRTTENSSGSQV